MAGGSSRISGLPSTPSAVSCRIGRWEWGGADQWAAQYTLGSLLQGRARGVGKGRTESIRAAGPTHRSNRERVRQRAWRGHRGGRGRVATSGFRDPADLLAGRGGTARPDPVL